MNVTTADGRQVGTQTKRCSGHYKYFPKESAEQPLGDFNRCYDELQAYCRRCNAQRMKARATGFEKLQQHLFEYVRDEREDLHGTLPERGNKIGQRALFNRLSSLGEVTGDYESATLAKWSGFEAQSGTAKSVTGGCPLPNPTQRVKTWSHPSTVEEAERLYNQAIARHNQPPAPPTPRQPKVIAQYLYGVTKHRLAVGGIPGIRVNLGWQETATADRPRQQIDNFDDADHSLDFLLPWPGARKGIEEYLWMDYIASKFFGRVDIIRRGEEFWIADAAYPEFMNYAKTQLLELSAKRMAA